MSDLMKIEFEGAEVRVIQTPQGPRFVAADVCRVLGWKNASDQIAKLLDDDEKGIDSIYTPGGPQEILTITEPGFNKLLTRSRKPIGKRFARFIFHEVLPCIRQHGCYPAPSITYNNSAIVPTDQNEIWQRCGEALLSVLQKGLDNFDSKVTEVRQNVSNLETALVKVNDDMNDGFQRVNGRLDAIEHRKHLKARTKQNHISVVARYYGGKCPCCLETLIVNSAGPPRALATLEFDHWLSKSNNAENATWPVCGKCNSELRNIDHKNNHVAPHFQSYQNRRRELKRVMDQKWLFPEED